MSAISTASKVQLIQSEVDNEELMLLNCGAGESFRLQGDQISQSYWKTTLNIHEKNDAEAPGLRLSEAKSRLIVEGPDARKD